PPRRGGRPPLQPPPPPQRPQRRAVGGRSRHRREQFADPPAYLLVLVGPPRQQRRTRRTACLLQGLVRLLALLERFVAEGVDEAFDLLLRRRLARGGLQLLVEESEGRLRRRRQPGHRPMSFGCVVAVEVGPQGRGVLRLDRGVRGPAGDVPEQHGGVFAAGGEEVAV